MLGNRKVGAPGPKSNFRLLVVTVCFPRLGRHGNAPAHPGPFTKPRRTGRHPLILAHSVSRVGHPGALCGQSPGKALREAVEFSVSG